MKKLKKLSIVAFIALSLNTANASGIPVVDNANLQQSVMNYMQMIKDYEQSITQYNQMLKDTANFEKQMQEMGIDMTSMNQILGNVLGMVSSMQDTYDDIKNIPQDTLKSISRVENACNFLEQQSSFFGLEIKRLSTPYSNKLNRCIAAISNATEINKSLDELWKKFSQTTDYDEAQKLKTQISNIENAREFLKQEANKQQASKLLSFYEVYHGKDTTNPYSKEKMTNDLKDLAKQLNKPNNEKQAQALTNSILLKILEATQRQYELTMEYTRANLQSASLNQVKDLSEEDFQQVYERKSIDTELTRLSENIQPVEKDEAGLPVIKLNLK